MLKNKKIILFLTVIYFALFLNTGHLCFCKDIDAQTGVCNCCHHHNSAQTHSCDCCLKIKSDAAKLAAEPHFDIPFLHSSSGVARNQNIFQNIKHIYNIKSYNLSYAPFRQNTDMLKTVILMN
jgi:hypothetical protein